MCPWPVGGGLQGEMQVRKTCSINFEQFIFIALARTSPKDDFLGGFVKLFSYMIIKTVSGATKRVQSCVVTLTVDASAKETG